VKLSKDKIDDIMDFMLNSVLGKVVIDFFRMAKNTYPNCDVYVSISIRDRDTGEEEVCYERQIDMGKVSL
jgi:hypothetical protein